MNRVTEYIRNNKDRDYTINDLVVKHYEIWLALPAVFFIMTPVIKFIVFSHEVNIHPLANEDIYFAIVLLLTVISLIPAALGITGCFISKKPSVRNEIKNYPVNLMFLIVCIIAVISTALYSFKDDPEVYSQTMFIYISYFGIYYFCSQNIEKQKIKVFIVDEILVISLFAGIIELIDLFIYHIPAQNYSGVTSVFIHANHYGYFFTVPVLLSSSMFLFSEIKAKKVFYLSVFVFNSVMLALSNTFGSFLGISVALVFMIIAVSIKKNHFSWRSVVLAITFLIVCFLVGLKFPSFFSDLVVLKNDIVNVVEDNEAQNTAGSGRWNLWRKTFELIRERPLLGWGFNGIFEQLSAVELGIGKPHNEYLETAVFFGIPAALIYIAGLISIFIKALKNRKTIDNVSTACLIASLAYIGSAFFGNVKFYTAPFFFIVLGLASRYKTDKPENATDINADSSKSEEKEPVIDGTLTTDDVL